MRDFLYCLIFPHSSNNHRAKILHPKILLTLIGFFFFSSIFFSKFTPFPSLKSYADISVQELLSYTNQRRQEAGVGGLTNNDLLSVAASRKADDMFAKNYWAHYSPDGVAPWFFIRDSGYNYIYAGENLARGFNSAIDVVNAWMASESHRANMLSPNFRDVGFAVKAGQLGGEDTLLVVEEFGSREVAVAQTQATPTPQPQVAKQEVLPTAAPTHAPSFAPTPTPKPVNTLYLGLPSLSDGLITSPNLNFSSKFALLMMFFFMTVLIIDIALIDKRKIVRFVGHNTDHFIFLGIVVVLIFVLNMGAII